MTDIHFHNYKKLEELISSKTYIAITKFGIVGGLSFIIDISVYYLLSQFLPTAIAKSLGIIVATYVNFQLNKHWTWGQKESKKGLLVKSLMLYLISGLTNVGTNELLLHYIPDFELAANFVYPNSTQIMKHIFSVKVDKIAAVLGATIVGMVINFMGQKLWVYSEKEN